MNKPRNLLDEIIASIEAFRDHSQGKLTLKTTELQQLPPAEKSRTNRKSSSRYSFNL